MNELMDEFSIHLKKYKKGYILEWSFMILFLLIIATVISHSFYQKYESVESIERGKIEVHSRIAKDYLTQQIHSINQLLLSLKQKLEREDAELNRLAVGINSQVKINRSIQSIVVFDRELEPIVSNDLDYYRAYHKDTKELEEIMANSADKTLYITKPYEVDGGFWTIDFVMPYANSSTKGVVVASMNSEFVMEIFESVFYSKNMRGGVISGDGVLYLLSPVEFDKLGKSVMFDGSIYLKHLRSGEVSSYYHELVHIFNEKGFISYYDLAPKDLKLSSKLTIVITKLSAPAYRELFHNFKHIVILYLLLVLFSTVFLYYSQKRRAMLYKKELELDLLNKKTLEEMAYVDALTQIYNRRYFDIALERAVKHAKRDKKSMAVIMVDIDFFKLYNDCFGHQMGDDCLRYVAQRLNSVANRSSDVVARYGGEEFVVVLGDIDYDSAMIKAEQIRDAIEQIKIPHAPSSAFEFVTISVGGVVFTPTDTSEIDSAIKRADEALYESKNSGRNRITIYQSPD